MRLPLATLVAAALTLFAAPLAAADQTGPDWVSSDNVEYLGSIKQDVGLTTGAKVVGDRLFVTSGKNISIYDISKPESPQTLGSMKVNVAWENEEVPTNGKVLAVASDFYSLDAELPVGAARDRLRAVLRRARPGQHQGGRLDPGRQPHRRVRARLPVLLRPRRAPSSTRAASSTASRRRLPATGSTELKAQGVDSKSCHHIREIRPGVLLTACRPFSVITVNAEGRPGRLARAPEGALHGRVRRVRALGALAAQRARQVRADRRRDQLHRPVRRRQRRVPHLQRRGRERRASRPPSTGPLADLQPAGNGTYTDGKPIANHLGCSVHWFQEHTTFKNGGLVALSEYEDGVRFLQIKRDGTIEEQGFFAAARRLVVVAEVGAERRRRLLARLRPRHRHHPLEGPALRAQGQGPASASAAACAGTRGTSKLPALTARSRPPRRAALRPAGARRAGRRASAASRQTSSPSARSGAAICVAGLTSFFAPLY